MFFHKKQEAYGLLIVGMKKNRPLGRAFEHPKPEGNQFLSKGTETSECLVTHAKNAKIRLKKP